MLSSFIYIRLVLSGLAIVANGTILALLVANRKQLWSQHNILLCNLAAADFFSGLSSLALAMFMIYYEFKSDTERCVMVLVPVVWGMLLSLCAVVPVAHYRVKLIKAYSVTATNFTEPWKLCSSLVTLWVVSCACSCLAYFSQVHEGHVNEGICLMSIAISDEFLLPFVLFASNVSMIVLLEYAKLLMQVLHDSTDSASGEEWHKYVKFDRRITRIVIIGFGVFAICWMPVHVSIIIYVFQRHRIVTEFEKKGGDIVTLLPLVHCAINPFIYTLSERDFFECLINALDRVVENCTCGLISRQKFSRRHRDQERAFQENLAIQNAARNRQDLILDYSIPQPSPFGSEKGAVSDLLRRRRVNEAVRRGQHVSHQMSQANPNQLRVSQAAQIPASMFIPPGYPSAAGHNADSPDLPKIYMSDGSISRSNPMYQSHTQYVNYAYVNDEFHMEDDRTSYI